MKSEQSIIDDEILKQSFPPLETSPHKASSLLEKCQSLVEQKQKKKTTWEDPHFCGICCHGCFWMMPELNNLFCWHGSFMRMRHSKAWRLSGFFFFWCIWDEHN